jgi:hypothetical protein
VVYSKWGSRKALLEQLESTLANEGKRVSRLQGRNVGQRAVAKQEYYGIAKYLDLTIQFIQSPLNMTPSMVKHDNLTLQVQSCQPRQRRNVGIALHGNKHEKCLVEHSPCWQIPRRYHEKLTRARLTTTLAQTPCIQSIHTRRQQLVSDPLFLSLSLIASPAAEPNRNGCCLHCRIILMSRCILGNNCKTPRAAVRGESPHAPKASNGNNGTDAKLLVCNTHAPCTLHIRHCSFVCWLAVSVLLATRGRKWGAPIHNTIWSVV